MKLCLFSPAKINLFLRMAFKRSDNYHEISSVFQAISLGDTLEIEIAKQDCLTCSFPSLTCSDSNLIWKAIYLFRQKTGCKALFQIHLKKQIPLEAGLGGGSSNAATALWGCNELTGRQIPLAQLQQWGSEIGSDVPFFFSKGTAYCTGRGEKVKDLPPLKPTQLCIVKPSQGLSTAQVYRHLILDKNFSEKDLIKERDLFLQKRLPYFNDLESAAFQINPGLKAIKDRLMQSGFHTVLITGSGSAFFCLGQGFCPEDLVCSVYPCHYIWRLPSHWYCHPH